MSQLGLAGITAAKPAAALRASLLGSFQLLVAAEALLAIFVGMLFLADKSLWLDEGITARVIGLDWGPFWDVVSESEGMHGLYYLFSKVWVSLGDDELMLRLPSVVFAAGAVVALAAIGRSLFDARVGLAAGLLLALNPFLIRYAQEARGAAMTALFATAATYVFIRLIQERRARWAVAYVMFSALAVYGHLFALMVIGAHLMSLAIAPRPRPSARLLASMAIGLGVLLLPLAWFVLTTSRDQASGIPASDIVDFIRHFSTHAGGRWLFLAYAPLAALALAATWLRVRTTEDGNAEPRGSAKFWPIAVVVLWIAVPTVLAFLASYARPMFLSRYLIVSLPGLVLLAGIGLAQFRSHWLFSGALAAMVALSLAGLMTTYDRPKEDWRGATEYITAEALPGDAIAFYLLGVEAPYDYYENQILGGDAGPRHLAYDATETSLSPEQQAFISRPSDLARSLTPDLPLISETSHERLWLVVSHASTRATDLVQASLEDTHIFVSERQFAVGVRVLLYDTVGVSQ